MVKKPNKPAVASEEEEAQWWPTQESKIADAFEKAAAEGRLQRGTIARRIGTIPPTTIRLDPADVVRARTQAEQRGLKYQTYIKMLLHDALRRRERVS